MTTKTNKAVLGVALLADLAFLVWAVVTILEGRGMMWKAAEPVRTIDMEMGIVCFQTNRGISCVRLTEDCD